MRVLVVGATGALGTRLVPQLRDAGHEVIGTSRSAARAERMDALGARPVVLDVLDPEATRTVVAAARPDAVVYQATALAGAQFGRSLDRTFGPTNRLRTEGLDSLLAAARAAGVRRFVAQSFAPYRYAHEGGWVKTEDDPLDRDPPASARQTFEAMAHLDVAVTAAGGIALRYGGFYGPGDEGVVGPVRRRRNPIVGGGDGVMSFVHLDDAAAATVLALDHDGPAVYNVVDDEPAPMRDWLPVLADAAGAKRPFHVPTWLARLVAGSGLAMMTEARGCSNAKAKRELGWSLRYPSWRKGFVAAYGRPAPLDGVPRS
ncbi:MAG: NAD(P)-dependent oxidoreductase [Streptosporangiales bacterium]|nr:NAD(P)-dependent oxidoreductase [Streptosporangiales bacterium]MBO0890773.1 NAD(P)-dependent oxidoreductase [Acidothermales bacterium]